MNSARIELVAAALRKRIYSETFGGKARGKFLLSRDSLKELLGVSRLSGSMLEAFTTECLNRGLTVIDMDESFAFAEQRFVKNWRKVPNAVVRKFVDIITKELGVDDELDEEAEEEEEDDPAPTSKRLPRRRLPIS
ncbi:hypothetical protein C6380_05165 [Pseudomonas syringae pv. actinidiae]|uniref:hypothetical protein n=1 Tax=Pseudomonas syringae TaxID=317 RepID=UPI000BB530B1|nr:hypothetical protein [Pseudomonas syringae]PBK51307.1 hypothetical protein BUE61_17610 [Pseudomonas syringae pv. actinidiae]PBK51875.1 hypothetical protein BUE60_17835 [Pseudomonas syringae pv. actinidiae]RJX54354.1 hypothetical protein C6379_15985 [Pseudomonas syringae pv. actinidiae]RJX60192.1 hypothetical protein C6380_05165 [Pseudomonas syringae pv. actinidiae]RJX60317.1 hypothetical protein C6383_13760 [Pseudomonas syringae pv. actinidiae]